MRTMKYLAVLGALVCAAAFTSCNANDDIDDTNGAVRFTAGIDQQATPAGVLASKAAGTLWGNDAIGIFMVEGTATHYANSKYTTAGTGAFTAAAGHEMYYPMSGNAVDFIAYYPYEDGATLGTPIDVTIGTTQTATNQPDFDLLWTKADNGGTGYDKVSHETTPVALTFEHKFAKIVMNCTADVSVGVPFDDMTVTIKGMNTVNTFDLSTGNLAAAGTPAPITPHTVTNGSAYDAIIMPGDYNAGDVTVDFKVGDDTFTWTLTATDASFEGGNEYTYAVTLTRTGVIVTGTISPWTTLGNDRGPVTAE